MNTPQYGITYEASVTNPDKGLIRVKGLKGICATIPLTARQGLKYGQKVDVLYGDSEGKKSREIHHFYPIGTSMSFNTNAHLAISDMTPLDEVVELQPGHQKNKQSSTRLLEEIIQAVHEINVKPEYAVGLWYSDSKRLDGKSPQERYDAILNVVSIALEGLKRRYFQNITERETGILFGLYHILDSLHKEYKIGTDQTVNVYFIQGMLDKFRVSPVKIKIGNS
ncbi:TPA: hypothetical protein HA246_04765 [Candidatus Woesearchaeota archaeon]|nr:hypothetical protein [Candidatus Woesearchaeota archaeon]